MIAVSLAGTLFFAATTDAQRGNVALYLLVTMAPFAVLAPVIGPALDRLQRGRRWALAGSPFGRAVLALVMVAALRRLLALPRGARRAGAVEVAQRAARRRRPAGAAAGHVADLGERPAVGLRAGDGRGRRRARRRDRGRCSASTGSCGATAVVFAVAGRARRAAAPARRRPDRRAARRRPDHRRDPGRQRAPPACQPARRPRAAGQRGAARARRLPDDLHARSWCRPPSPTAGTATLALGAVAAAAGLGSFAGTGRRLAACTPPRPTAWCCRRPAAAAAVTVLAAVFYSFAMAAVVAGVAAVTNALGKVSLDAIIQREVPEQPARVGVRPVGDRAAAGLGRRRRARHRAAADRLARLHRRRGAARARRRARAVEPATAAGRPARGGRRPEAPTTPVGPPWS